MAVAAFDTLKFANTLKEAGVPAQQAEAQAIAFAEILKLNFQELVTKEDLRNTKEELRNELKQTEMRLDAKIDKLGERLDAKMDRLDAKMDRVDAERRGELVLLKRMFGATFAGVVAILIRLFIFRGV